MLARGVVSLFILLGFLSAPSPAVAGFLEVCRSIFAQFAKRPVEVKKEIPAQGLYSSEELANMAALLNRQPIATRSRDAAYLVSQLTRAEDIARILPMIENVDPLILFMNFALRFGTEASRYVKSFGLDPRALKFAAQRAEVRDLSKESFPINGYQGLRSFDWIENYGLDSDSLIALAKDAAKVNPFAVLRNLHKLKLSPADEAALGREILLDFQNSTFGLRKFALFWKVNKRKPGAIPAVKAFEEFRAAESSVAEATIRYGLTAAQRFKVAQIEVQALGDKTIDRLQVYSLNPHDQFEFVKFAMDFDISNLGDLLRKKPGQSSLSLEQRLELAEKQAQIYPVRMVETMPLFRLPASRLLRVLPYTLRLPLGLLDEAEKEILRQSLRHDPINVSIALLNSLGMNLDSPESLFKQDLSTIEPPLQRYFPFLEFRFLKELSGGEFQELMVENERKNRLVWKTFEASLRSGAFENKAHVDWLSLSSELTGIDVVLLRKLREESHLDLFKFLEAAIQTQSFLNSLVNGLLQKPHGPLFEEIGFKLALFEANDFENLKMLIERIHQVIWVHQMDRGFWSGEIGKILEDILQPHKKKFIAPADVETMLRSVNSLLSDGVKAMLRNGFPQSKEVLSHSEISDLSEKWGDLSLLFTYLARMRFGRLRPLNLNSHDASDYDLLIRALRAEIENQYPEFKFLAVDSSPRDIQIAKDQLRSLTPEQLGAWGLSTSLVIAPQLPAEELTDDRRKDLSAGLPATSDDLDQKTLEALLRFQGDPKVFIKSFQNPRSELPLSEYLLRQLFLIVKSRPTEEVSKAWQVVQKVNAVIDSKSKATAELGRRLKEIKSLGAPVEPSEILVTIYSHDLKPLLYIGNCLAGTCQDLEAGSHFESLLAYAVDANIKVGMHFLLPLKNAKTFSENDKKEFLEASAAKIPVHASIDPRTNQLELSWSSTDGSRKMIRSIGAVKFFGRDIVKIGESEDGLPRVVFEPFYGDGRPEAADFEAEILQTIRSNFSNFWGIPQWNGVEKVMFSRSRNPGGVYSDENGGIQESPYSLPAEKESDL